MVGTQPEILKMALEIMEKYKLKQRDAIHMVSMLERKVFTIVTQDQILRK